MPETTKAQWEAVQADARATLKLAQELRDGCLRVLDPVVDAVTIDAVETAYEYALTACRRASSTAALRLAALRAER